MYRSYFMLDPHTETWEFNIVFIMMIFYFRNEKIV